MKRTIAGFGNTPQVAAEVTPADGLRDVQAWLARTREGLGVGLRQSYGDACLAPDILDMRGMDRFLAFEPETGVLTCEAGTTFSDINRHFIPRGYFPPVTPGTDKVTLGGAVSADVHGKNHHQAGTFGSHVLDLELCLPSGERRTVDPQGSPDLFRAVVGGMGLMGVITKVRFPLRRIPSAYVRQRNLAARSLREMLDLFEEHAGATFSLAWLDSRAGGGKLGRGILTLGEHAAPGNLPSELRGAPFHVGPQRTVTVPFTLPAWAPNPFRMRLFNALFYAAQRRSGGERVVDYRDFFYPLERLGSWNRLFGSRGLVEYQFVAPLESAADCLEGVLRAVQASGLGTFIAGLKLFGPENGHFLSFPTRGYTLGMDFPRTPALEPLLERLDALVLDHGGRLYLAKDARMSPAMFRGGYPRLDDFLAAKAAADPEGRLCSLQSRRLLHG